MNYPRTIMSLGPVMRGLPVRMRCFNPDRQMVRDLMACEIDSVRIEFDPHARGHNSPRDRIRAVRGLLGWDAIDERSKFS